MKNPLGCFPILDWGQLDVIFPTSWLDVSAPVLGSKPRQLEHLATPTGVEGHKRNLKSHGDIFTKRKKNTDFFVLLCLPASFLTFGKVNDSPPQTDIFWGGGGGFPPHPPPVIFVSAGPPPSD